MTKSNVDADMNLNIILINRVLLIGWITNLFMLLIHLLTVGTVSKACVTFKFDFQDEYI